MQSSIKALLVPVYRLCLTSGSGAFTAEPNLLPRQTSKRLIKQFYIRQVTGLLEEKM